MNSLNKQITVRGGKVTLPELPEAVRGQLTLWRDSPQQSWQCLPVLKPKEILSLPSPTLAQIKTRLSEERAIMILSLAIYEAVDFVNVGKRMTEQQMALTAKLILNRFWYFRMEDIKACFYGHLLKDQIYTLDGQTFLRWLSAYDLERDNACEILASETTVEPAPPEEASISYTEWRSRQSPEELARHDHYLKSIGKPETEAERHRKKLDFWTYKQQYLKSKNKEK